MTSDDWTALGAIGQMLAAGVTAVMLFLVRGQIRGAGKVAHADFVLRMYEGFTSYHSKTFQKFASKGAWAPDTTVDLTPEEVTELEHYFAYFETLQLLRTQHLLTLDVFDKMFAYRFFIAANNPHSKKVLDSKAAYWKLLYTLFDEWRAYRNDLKQEIPQQEYSLK